MLIFVGKQLKTEKQLIRPLLFEVKLEISRLDIEPFSTNWAGLFYKVSQRLKCLKPWIYKNAYTAKGSVKIKREKIAKCFSLREFWKIQFPFLLKYVKGIEIFSAVSVLASPVSPGSCIWFSWRNMFLILYLPEIAVSSPLTDQTIFIDIFVSNCKEEAFNFHFKDSALKEK